MDQASRKRKASNATPSTSEGSASKKLKLLNSNHVTSKASSVQEVGQKIVSQLKNSQDKSGFLTFSEFFELPDQDELPEYYEFTKLPLALGTIEDKLKRNEYPTVTTLESDLKRMVQNAKDYNDPDSQIYDDAEKIRKLVFNFMKVNNPAYKEDQKYQAFPTPIPKSVAAPVQNGMHAESEADASESRAASERPKRPSTAKSSEQPDRKSSIAPSGTTGDGEAGVEEGVDLDFTGKTYTEAQQSIIAHLLRYTDEEGLEIYSPFGNLPTRKLEDYYKVIRHPVSLKSVAKRCRGQHGRAPPTGTTDFKTWDAFEEEVSYLWRNARVYNEDGSEMYDLATDFETHFRSLLAEAKEKIDEPSGPRIKLGGPKPKVTLNLSQHRNSPTPGVSVDNDALLRQRRMVAAGVNGQQTGQQAQRQGPAPNGIARSTSQVPPTEGARPSSSTQSGSPVGTAVKSEKGSTQTPPLNPLLAPQPLTNGMMPPPAMRPSSGSPYPGQLPLTSTTTNNFPYTAPALLPPTQLRSYPRESALLPTVTIKTHPQLKIPVPFRLPIPPHHTLSHQSTTLTLPSSHYFVQIAPTISKQLSMGRAYKMFVSVNGTRLSQRDTQFHADSGKRTHVYEGSLAQGVNRIEVEVAAAKVGDGMGGEGKGLDVEKVTVFANLMRA